VKFRELTGDPPSDAEDSAAIRDRVINARRRQSERFAHDGIFSNAAMTPRSIRTYCRIDSESKRCSNAQ
jgi:magnesium chelatase family protein